MAEHASHPVFARVYARVAEMSERRGGAERRRKLLTGLQGRVVEVGAGSGANFQNPLSDLGQSGHRGRA